MGLDVPIVNTPMGGAAGGALAAAVSRAGGLGMIGMGSSATVEQLHGELPRVSGLDRPFGSGWCTGSCQRNRSSSRLRSPPSRRCWP
jgi:nitronate monooxygenase